MMWYGHHHELDEAHGWLGGAYGGDWLMFFGMILVPVLLVILVVWLMRAWTPQAAATGSHSAAAASPQGESPREIVKRRYAAGEIDREDYFQRLKDL